MTFKSVSLRDSYWEEICATLEECGNDNDKRNAAMIREQLSGSIVVKVTKNIVCMSAKKGGDIRDSLPSDSQSRLENAL